MPSPARANAPLARRAGRLSTRREFRPLANAYLGRPFGPRARGPRVAIYHEQAPITMAQVYPFLVHAGDLRARHGAQVRAMPVAHFLDGPAPHAAAADIVLVAPWFDVAPDRLGAAFERAREANPQARFGFVDSFAPADLRLGRTVDPHVEWYLKKSVFADPSQYAVPFRGDTNLTDYYTGLYGLPAEPVDWDVPPGLLRKLHLSPNFLTAPAYEGAFAPGRPLFEGDRPLDMQTRLGAKGSPWYAAMRTDALERARGLDGVTVSPAGGRVSYAAYLDEMAHAKLCFSPFGYGELCWRDIEAFQTGALLIKPDMGHLRTLPDLYEAGETYLPVRWDFSDLEAVVRGALADRALRERIAQTAYDRCADYLAQARFVDDVAPLFAPRT